MSWRIAQRCTRYRVCQWGSTFGLYTHSFWESSLFCWRCSVFVEDCHDSIGTLFRKNIFENILFENVLFTSGISMTLVTLISNAVLETEENRENNSSVRQDFGIWGWSVWKFHWDNFPRYHSFLLASSLTAKSSKADATAKRTLPILLRLWPFSLVDFKGVLHELGKVLKSVWGTGQCWEGVWPEAHRGQLIGTVLKYSAHQWYTAGTEWLLAITQEDLEGRNERDLSVYIYT